MTSKFSVTLMTCYDKQGAMISQQELPLHRVA